MRKAAFRLYILFIISWFLHMGSRIPPLGTIRFDLLLLLAIGALVTLSEDEEKSVGETAPSDEAKQHGTRTRKLIATLLAYAFFTLPLVQWPGSVLNAGLPNFIKAVVFYFLTAKLVNTPSRQRVFLVAFVAAMTFRVIEPVFLHVTTGYWGSFATMSDFEYLDRLSGAPSDVINPNGLAFVILTVLPFLHFLSPLTILGRLAYVAILPILLWALLLTGSRSGMIGLVVVLVSIWYKSQRKIVLTSVLAVGCLVALPLLPPDLSDRYRSIFDSHTKNAGTAEGRLTGLKADLAVAMRRPFFGHGLGTSLEANANFGNGDQPSHNLYLETAQELGFIGVLILIALVVSIVSNLRTSLAALKATATAPPLLLRLADAVQVWLAMNILLSFASYGLSSYEWYLAAGLSDVLYRASQTARAADASVIAPVLVKPVAASWRRPSEVVRQMPARKPALVDRQ